MKNGFSFLAGILVSTGLVFSAQSCTKTQGTRSSSSDSTASTTATSSTIAVSVDSAGTDSVYLLQYCGRGNYRDSIAAASLPSASTAYLDSGYSGYSLIQAYIIKDSAGTTRGYVAVIRYNGIPVGLLFNADGTFAQVLEQRERGDMHGRGYHQGGRYGNRDGRQHDTVALSALPAAISSWFSSNHPADTLLKAYRNIDSSYIVISKDTAIWSNLFSSGGDFVGRREINVHHTQVTMIDAGALPAAATTYLTNTYAGYVFQKGFSFTLNGVVSGYLVFIDASNSKYAVEFDASGNFLGAVTLF